MCPMSSTHADLPIHPPSHEESPTGRDETERAYYRLSHDVYAFFAPFYDAVTMPLRKLRRQVASLAGFGPGARVLDVATGTGAQAIAFAEKGTEVVGIDLSDAMLRIAKRKKPSAKTTFRQADATALPFPDASFDGACVSFALHEMPQTIRERVVREMARAVRPGGRLVVVDYALPKAAVLRWLAFHAIKLYEHDAYPEFVRSDLGALLEKAGARVERHVSALRGIAGITLARTPENRDER